MGYPRYPLTEKKKKTGSAVIIMLKNANAVKVLVRDNTVVPLEPLWVQY